MTGLRFLESSIQRQWANHHMLLSPVYTSLSRWLLLGCFEPRPTVKAWGSSSQTARSRITSQQLRTQSILLAYLWLPAREGQVTVCMPHRTGEGYRGIGVPRDIGYSSILYPYNSGRVPGGTSAPRKNLYEGLFQFLLLFLLVSHSKAVLSLL